MDARRARVKGRGVASRPLARPCRERGDRAWDGRLAARSWRSKGSRSSIRRWAVAASPGASGASCVQLPEAGDAETRARLARRFPERARGRRRRSRSTRSTASARSCAARRATSRAWRSTWTACRRSTAACTTRRRATSRRERRSRTARSPRASASPGSARAVGQALGRNPFAIVVPCHRVLAAGGKAGRLLGQRRRHDEDAHADDRGREGRAGRRSSTGDGGFAFDPAAAVEHLRASDPALARLIDAVGPFRMQLAAHAEPVRRARPGHRLPAAQRQGRGDDLRARVRALPARDASGSDHEHILRASDETLRGAGLSRSKMLSLQDLARRSSARRDPDARRGSRDG